MSEDATLPLTSKLVMDLFQSRFCLISTNINGFVEDQHQHLRHYHNILVPPLVSISPETRLNRSIFATHYGSTSEMQFAHRAKHEWVTIPQPNSTVDQLLRTFSRSLFCVISSDVSSRKHPDVLSRPLSAQVYSSDFPSESVVAAVLSGCIPVIVAEAPLFPFSAMIKWDAFSVLLKPAKAANLLVGVLPKCVFIHRFRLLSIQSALPKWKTDRQ